MASNTAKPATEAAAPGLTAGRIERLVAAGVLLAVAAMLLGGWFFRQQTASIKERELREAAERAKQQTALTESDISIAVHSNQGKADLARVIAAVSCFSS